MSEHFIEIEYAPPIGPQRQIAYVTRQEYEQILLRIRADETLSLKLDDYLTYASLIDPNDDFGEVIAFGGIPSIAELAVAVTGRSGTEHLASRIVGALIEKRLGKDDFLETP